MSYFFYLFIYQLLNYNHKTNKITYNLNGLDNGTEKKNRFYKNYLNNESSVRKVIEKIVGKKSKMKISLISGNQGVRFGLFFEENPVTQL